MRRLALAPAAFLAVLAGPAAAIVGDSRDASSLSDHLIMVLNRSGRTAGFCSAVVVAPRAVLTAAHCVPPGAAVTVHYKNTDGSPVLLDVAALIRHPGYRADAIRSRQRSIDLALVELRAPLPAPFTPARLGGAAEGTPGTPFRVAGFGLSTEGAPASGGQLRIAEIAARPPRSDLLLWAADPAGHGSGACTGDSGGPILPAGEDRVVALTLWSAGPAGHSCGSLTQALWLTPQLGWIDATLAGWGLERPR